MSWTQGIQPREELPEWFVKWADERADAHLEYITWFGGDENIVYLDFGPDNDSIRLDLTGTRFDIKAKP